MPVSLSEWRVRIGTFVHWIREYEVKERRERLLKERIRRLKVLCERLEAKIGDSGEESEDDKSRQDGPDPKGCPHQTSNIRSSENTSDVNDLLTSCDQCIQDLLMASDSHIKEILAPSDTCIKQLLTPTDSNIRRLFSLINSCSKDQHITCDSHIEDLTMLTPNYSNIRELIIHSDSCFRELHMSADACKDDMLSDSVVKDLLAPRDSSIIEILQPKDYCTNRLLTTRDSYIQESLTSSDSYIQELLTHRGSCIQKSLTRRDSCIQELLTHRGSCIQKSLTPRDSYIQKSLTSRDSGIQELLTPRDTYIRELISVNSHIQEMFTSRDSYTNKLLTTGNSYTNTSLTLGDSFMQEIFTPRDSHTNELLTPTYSNANELLAPGDSYTQDLLTPRDSDIRKLLTPRDVYTNLSIAPGDSYIQELLTPRDSYTNEPFTQGHSYTNTSLTGDKLISPTSGLDCDAVQHGPSGEKIIGPIGVSFNLQEMANISSRSSCQKTESLKGTVDVMLSQQPYLTELLLVKAGDVELNPGPLHGQIDSVLQEIELIRLAEEVPGDCYYKLCNGLGFSSAQSKNVLSEKHLDFKEALIEMFNVWKVKQRDGTDCKAFLGEILQNADMGALQTKLLEGGYLTSGTSPSDSDIKG